LRAAAPRRRRLRFGTMRLLRVLHRRLDLSGCQIRKCVLVEHGDEGVERIIEHGVDARSAAVPGVVRTALDVDVRHFDGANHIADANIFGPRRQSDAAAGAANSSHETGARQDMNDLEGILLGEFQPLGDIGDLDQRSIGIGAIGENADGVTGLLGEAHAV